MEVLGVVVFLVVGGYFLFVYMKAKAESLPLNHVAGLRTRTIMTNSAVWSVTHRKFSFIFLVDALLFFFCAVVLGVCAVMKYSISSHSTAVILIIAAIILLWIVTVGGGYAANQFAKKIRDGENHV